MIVPFSSCTCCWNRSRFTCVEGSDINWLSFMSLIFATENSYTPAQLEALVESSQLSSSFLSRLRFVPFPADSKVLLDEIHVRNPNTLYLFVVCSVVILLVHANTNLFHLQFNDFLTCKFQARILLLDLSVQFHRSRLRLHPSPWTF